MTPRPITPLSLVDQAAASQRAEDARARAASADGKLQGAGQGTDPDYVTTADRFQSMTYDQLYQAVHGDGGLDAAGLQGQAGTWRQASSDVLNLSTFNLVGMTRLFNEGQWQGATADAGRAATESFAKALNEVGQVLGSVGARVEAVGYAAEAVKLAVQPKGASSGTIDPDDPVQSILPGLSNPATDEQTRAAEAAARDAIIQALDTTYTPVFPPSGAGVPAYGDLPAVGDGSGAADPGTGGSSGQGGGVGANQGTPVTSEPAEAPSQPAEDTDSPQETEQSSKDDTGGGQNADDAATDPSSTSPASTNPAQAASPSTGVPGGGGPGTGSPGGAGAPGSGTPSSGGSGSGVSGPVLGRGVPGAGASAAGQAITAGPGTGSGAGARNGMMPGMGVPGGGRGGKREDSDEHYAPDYLRGVQPDWAEGIVAYNGVLGGEVELMPDAHQSAPAMPNHESPATTAPASSAGNQRQPAVSPSFPVDTPHDSSRETSATAPAALSTPAPQQRIQEAPAPAMPVDSIATPSTTADEPRTVQQSAEQSFEYSGAGPVMDDAAQEPTAAEPSAEDFFQHTGTGPVMDDAAAAPPAEEFFQHTGTGPVMDEPGTAARQ
ncbi:hypothetical protein [Nocardia neocaledoniensis]|uniref:hypothetical protein n=1 Tax=Nocardia neocaledoniensis TaxID=236511 RepID=UPI002458D46D|nr:hypothetical protein [Nocardia neocaledoniensis]